MIRGGERERTRISRFRLDKYAALLSFYISLRYEKPRYSTCAAAGGKVLYVLASAFFHDYRTALLGMQEVCVRYLVECAKLVFIGTIRLMVFSGKFRNIFEFSVRMYSHITSSI